MKKVTIWHNTRCSKSRAAVALLDDNNIEYDTYKYLEQNPNKDDIKAVLLALDISPRELIRTKEDIYKELNLENELDDEALILAMVKNPKLIERPIVVSNDKAVIGRPIENISSLLNL